MKWAELQFHQSAKVGSMNVHNDRVLGLDADVDAAFLREARKGTQGSRMRKSDVFLPSEPAICS